MCRGHAVVPLSSTRISHTFFNENVYLYIVLDQQNVHVPGLRFLCMMYVLYMIIVLSS